MLNQTGKWDSQVPTTHSQSNGEPVSTWEIVGAVDERVDAAVQHRSQVKDISQNWVDLMMTMIMIIILIRLLSDDDNINENDDTVR